MEIVEATCGPDDLNNDIKDQLLTTRLASFGELCALTEFTPYGNLVHELAVTWSPRDFQEENASPPPGFRAAVAKLVKKSCLPASAAVSPQGLATTAPGSAPQDQLRLLQAALALSSDSVLFFCRSRNKPTTSGISSSSLG
ncbi:unnamed protein product [Prorocentrum cordatum]|uniref:Uncharacterized protein n=1 Tax=Prorocentrum cordatum TaxID=2364126 RepID=A0ABN9S128_9DINO|nr:unnamed protein product [Polarella glacialis]